jgi:hypothetical protein
MAAAAFAVQDAATQTDRVEIRSPPAPPTDLTYQRHGDSGEQEGSLLSLITALVSHLQVSEEEMRWRSRAHEVLRTYCATEVPKSCKCIPVLIAALTALPEDGTGRTMILCHALKTLCKPCFAVVCLDHMPFVSQNQRTDGATLHGRSVVEKTPQIREMKEEDFVAEEGKHKKKSPATLSEPDAHAVPSIEPIESENHVNAQPGAPANDDYMSWRMRSNEERKLLKKFKTPESTPCLRCLEPSHGFKDLGAPCRGQKMAPFDKEKIVKMLQEAGDGSYASGVSQSSHTTTRTRTTSYRPFPSSSGTRSGYETNTSYTQQLSAGSPGFATQTSIKPIWSSPAPGPPGGAILEGEHPRVAEHLCVPAKRNTSNSSAPLPTATDLYQHDVDDDLGRIRDVPKIEIFIPDPESSNYCEASGDCTKPSVAQEQQEVKKKIIAGEFDELGCGRDISSEELVRLLLPKRTPVGERVRRSKTCAGDVQDDLVDGGGYPTRRNSG